jgi:hypothetical protein
MAYISAALLLLFIAVAQVTVAPRYPLSAAFPDYMLVTLVVWAILRPTEDTMVALPLGALFLGAVGPLSVMVLTFIYITILPAALLLRALSPLGSFLNAIVLLIGATLLRDLVLAAEAVSAGANVGTSDIVLRAFFPGLALNLLLFPFFYFGIRFLGPRASFAGWRARAY